MSGHTPGPWEVKPYLRPDLDDDPMGVYLVEPIHTKLTKIYFELDPSVNQDFDKKTHGVNEANARLIGAAPDMLEALKAILPVFDNDGAAKYCKVYSKEIAAAESAIAKAEGREG